MAGINNMLAIWQTMLQTFVMQNFNKSLINTNYTFFAASGQHAKAATQLSAKSAMELIVH